MQDEPNRLTTLVLRLTAIALAVGKLSCYKLWLSTRVFPIVPPFQFVSWVAGWVHAALFLSSLLMMLVLLFFPFKKLFLYLLLMLELASCLLDETRWMPWEYQYLLTMVIFLANWQDKNKIMALLVVLLGCTYIYSGAAKFNSAFVNGFWQFKVLHTLLHFPMHATRRPMLHYMGYLLPMIETTSGILLLVGSYRKLGAMMMMMMHVFILLLLGPFDFNYNSSVWPWNLAMIAYLYIIYKNPSLAVTRTATIKEPILNLPIIILVVAMPALHLIGLWPHYFSFSLYSHKEEQFLVAIGKNTAVPKELVPYFKTISPNDTNSKTTLQKWALKEINSPPFPERGYYIKFKDAFLNKFPNCGARFYIIQSNGLKDIELR